MNKSRRILITNTRKTKHFYAKLLIILYIKFPKYNVTFRDYLKATATRSEKVMIKVNRMTYIVFSLFCFKIWYIIGFMLVLTVIIIFSRIYISNP